jgi:hypothetical protein
LINIQVLIAQERVANNKVCVFKKIASKYSCVAEIRSYDENSNKPASPLFVTLTARQSIRMSGQLIRATVPYIREVKFLKFHCTIVLFLKFLMDFLKLLFVDVNGDVKGMFESL